MEGLYGGVEGCGREVGQGGAVVFEVLKAGCDVGNVRRKSECTESGGVEEVCAEGAGGVGEAVCEDGVGEGALGGGGGVELGIAAYGVDDFGVGIVCIAIVGVGAVGGIGGSSVVVGVVATLRQERHHRPLCCLLCYVRRSCRKSIQQACVVWCVLWCIGDVERTSQRRTEKAAHRLHRCVLCTWIGGGW